jgi:hypothetical protein
LIGRLRAALPKEASMNTHHQNPTRKELSMNDRMEILAQSFPTLRGVPGTQPWDPERFETWAAGPAPSHGAFCAARFILAVYNSTDEWQCGTFDLMEALACWDDQHRAAFLEWVREPWWP